MSILNGWKEIGDCLKVTSRSAQRWERLGLPIRRVSDTPRSRVMASSEDIELWIRKKSVLVPYVPAEPSLDLDAPLNPEPPQDRVPMHLNLPHESFDGLHSQIARMKHNCELMRESRERLLCSIAALQVTIQESHLRRRAEAHR
jgi:hypothetical protein